MSKKGTLPTFLYNFLSALNPRNKEIDDITDANQRLAQRLALRDQLREVEPRLDKYLITYQRVQRSYKDLAPKFSQPRPTKVTDSLNELIRRFNSHENIDISKAFEDIDKLDKDFLALKGKGLEELATKCTAAEKLCDTLGKAIPQRKKEFEKRFASASPSELQALHLVTVP
jgi:DNA repair ATPase RecN